MPRNLLVAVDDSDVRITVPCFRVASKSDVGSTCVVWRGSSWSGLLVPIIYHFYDIYVCCMIWVCRDVMSWASCPGCLRQVRLISAPFVNFKFQYAWDVVLKC